jgi:hypothetical protein
MSAEDKNKRGMTMNNATDVENSHCSQRSGTNLLDVCDAGGGILSTALAILFWTTVTGLPDAFPGRGFLWNSLKRRHSSDKQRKVV